MPRRVYLLGVGLALLALALGGGRGMEPAPPPVPVASPPASLKVEAPGLHNVYRLSDRLYSGSSPEGDAGFASLQQLGIRTVLSVDGARPDVGRARRHGLRYVHLPIGYDGVPEPQALRIARAVRDLPGPRRREEEDGPTPEAARGVQGAVLLHQRHPRH